MPERRIATVVMLDVVRSTEIAAQLGDARYRELSSRFGRSVRAGIKRFGGREEDNAGDGFFATFPQPDRAIRFATSLAEDIRAFGIEIRSGIHTGQTETQDGKAQGIAVVIGARVMSLAGAGEILVTSTTKELVTGSGFTFEDFSNHELKGVPGTWQVFAVTSVDDQARPRPLVAEEAARRLDEIQPSTEPVSRRRRAALIGGTAALVAIATIALVVEAEDGSTPRTAGSGPDSESVVNISLDGSVLASIPAPASQLVQGEPDPEHPMAVGQGAVWALRPTDRLLYHIDPDDQEVEKKIALPGGFFQYNVAVGFDRVWIAHVAGLGEVNPATNDYREVFPVRAARDVGQIVATDLAIGGGFVWLSVGDGRLIRIDPATGHGQPIEDLGPIDTITYGHGSVWTADTVAGLVARYDPDTMTRLGEPIEIPAGIDIMISGDHAVWALSRSTGTLTEIDIAESVADHIVPVGNGLSGLAAGDGTVWVGDEDGTLHAVDEDTRQVTDIPFGAEIRALAFDDDTETLWVDVA